MGKNILIYGFGKLGSSLAANLLKMGNEIIGVRSSSGSSHHTYEHGSVWVNGRLPCDAAINETHYIVVSCTGDVLEENIDSLLSLKKRMIILSTKYDQKLVADKAEKEEVAVVMSDNMALAIVDFWDRLQKLPEVPAGNNLLVFLEESHQSTKADISGSGIKSLWFLKEKGYLVDFDDSHTKGFQKGIDGQYGCVQCIRQESTQLKIGVPREHLAGHGYHHFMIFYDEFEINSEIIAYLQDVYEQLKSLEELSIPGVLEFKISINDDGLFITHNVNGRDVYSDGVVKSIEFLNDKKSGVYTAIDVINSK